jgi:hypothetical protein
VVLVTDCGDGDPNCVMLGSSDASTFMFAKQQSSETVALESSTGAMGKWSMEAITGNKAQCTFDRYY